MDKKKLQTLAGIKPVPYRTKLKRSLKRTRRELYKTYLMFKLIVISKVAPNSKMTKRTEQLFALVCFSKD